MEARAGPLRVPAEAGGRVLCLFVGFSSNDMLGCCSADMLACPLRAAWMLLAWSLRRFLGLGFPASIAMHEQPSLIAADRLLHSLNPHLLSQHCCHGIRGRRCQEAQHQRRLQQGMLGGDLWSRVPKEACTQAPVAHLHSSLMTWQPRPPVT